MTERSPTAVPARIAPLPNLPLFHKVEGRKTVVAGASQGAVWKAELLSAAGADVLVLAGNAEGASLYEALAAHPVKGPLTVLARRWEAADLAGAAVAIGDLPDREDALAFAAAARSAGAPLNLVDQTELCDVQFGTIVNRAPVVLAISTDGGAPMLGQSIRARIESVLPFGLSAWARAALEWRPRLKGRVTEFADRRHFWSRFTQLAWHNVDRAPDEADFEALIAGETGEKRVGTVTLVGAGPGDPELLTLKAMRALQSATVILYDDLVGPEILELARREARRVSVGKSAGRASCRQQDINGEMVKLALAGETVVRLKGGDSLIFGRATEELDACREAFRSRSSPASPPRRALPLRSESRSPNAIMRGGFSSSPATAPTAPCRPTWTGRRSPTVRRPRSSTCRARRWDSWSPMPLPPASIRRRRRAPSPRPRAPTRPR